MTPKSEGGDPAGFGLTELGLKRESVQPELLDVAEPDFTVRSGSGQPPLPAGGIRLGRIRLRHIEMTSTEAPHTAPGAGASMSLSDFPLGRQVNGGEWNHKFESLVSKIKRGCRPPPCRRCTRG